MGDNSGLYYLPMVHLGSVVAVLACNGDLKSDESYLPIGGLRDTIRISHIDFAFNRPMCFSGMRLMDNKGKQCLATEERFMSTNTFIQA